MAVQSVGSIKKNTDSLRKYLESIGFPVDPQKSDEALMYEWDRDMDREMKNDLSSARAAFPEAFPVSNGR